MTLLAPGYLVAALVAGLAVVAAHLIAWRRPTDALLPTARFVPDEPTRRSARAIRPSDLMLLVLRLAVVALAGLALARPALVPPRSGVARVVAVERSRAVADPTAARDTALAWVEGATTVMVMAFDTAAAVVAREALTGDSAAVPAGRLTSALVALLREGERLLASHERVELAIVSSFTTPAWDAATATVRALWPDTLRLIRMPTAAAGESGSVEVGPGAEDPVVAGIRLALAHRQVRPERDVRVVREVPSSDDSAWARAADRLLVVWPRLPRETGAGAGGETGPAVTGVYAGAATLPGHFRARQLPPSGTPVAWWLDGQVAATEMPHGAGCIRQIGFDLPDEGDLPLTVGFQRLAAVLLAPCGGAILTAWHGEPVVSALAAPDSALALAHGPAAGRTRNLARLPNRIGSALLALALTLLVVEQWVRQRRLAASREEVRT